MLRKPLGERLAAHPLAREIDLRHEVDAPLLVDAETRLLADSLEVAGPQHDFDCCREIERVRQRWIGERA